MTITQFTPADVAPDRTNYDVQLEQDPSFKDLMAANIKDFTISKGIDALAQHFAVPPNEPEKDYDPYNDIAGYEQYANAFIGSESRADTDQVKKQIDAREQNNAVMQSGGFKGVAASLAAGLLDPVNLIPIAGEANIAAGEGSTILKGAARTALSMGAITTGNEYLQHELDPTRTMDESEANVATATLLGGVIGGAAEAIGGHPMISKMADDVEPHLAANGAMPEVGAALDEPASPTFIGRQLAKLKSAPPETGDVPDIQSPTGGLSSAGAAVTNDLTLDQEGLKSALGAEKLFQFQDPLLRTAQSPSIVTRQLMEQLAENPLSRNKNVEGIASEPSVQNKIASYDLPKYLYQQEKDRLFLDYRGKSNVATTKLGDAVDGVSSKVFGRARDDGKLTYHEFGEEITKAMRREDTHEIPQVAEAARFKREKVLDPIFKEAQNVGLIDPDIEQPKTALSYAQRIWNKPAIQGDRAAFQDINEQWLREKRDGYAGEVANHLKALDVTEGPIAETLKEVKAEYNESASTRKEMQRKAEATGATIDTTTGNINDIHARLEEQTKNQQRLYEKILTGRDRGDQDLGDLFNEFKSTSTLKRDLYKRLAHHEGVLEEKGAKLERRQALADKLNEHESALEDKVGKLEKHADEIGLLQRKASFGDEDLKDTAYQLTDRILGTPAGRLSYDNQVGGGAGAGGVARRGPARARVYDIPDARVEKFLVNDDNVLTESYVKSLASDIELTKKFGSIDPEDQLKKIQDSYQRLENGITDPKQLRDLKKKQNGDIRDFKAVWDRLRGTYGTSDDYASGWSSAERVAMNMSYLANLGGVALSKVSEMARPVMVHGIKNTMMDGIVPMVNEFKNFRAATRDVREASVGLDMVLNTRGRALGGLDEFTPFTNKAEAVTGAMSHSFGAISLFAPYNAAIKQFCGVITQTRMLRSIEQLAKGATIKPAELEYLAANFIDKPMASRIMDQYSRFGDKTENVRIPNARSWDDREVAETFRAAVQRDVNRTIVTPGQDKPLWLSKPGLRLMGQFHSFALASTQRVMLSGLQQRDAGVVSGAIFASVLGAASYIMKAKSAGYEPDYDLGNLISEGVDRSGLSGWLTDANNIAEKVSRGRIGMNALMGGPPMSRYASRSALESIFGPTYGMLGNLIQLTGNSFAGDWQAQDTHTIRRLMPFQNVFYLNSIFNEMEHGVNRSFNIPEQQRND